MLNNIPAADDAPYVEDLDAREPGDTFWNAADDLQYITYQVSDRRVYTVYLTSAARRARGIEEGWLSCV